MPKKWEEALIPTPPGVINYPEMQFMPHKDITLDATYLSWRFISFLVGVLFYMFKDNFFQGP
jgi:hypothetical protein